MLKATSAQAFIAGLAIAILSTDSNGCPFGWHSNPAEMALTDVLNKFEAVVIARLDSQELSGRSTDAESNERSVKVTEVIRGDAKLKGISVGITVSKDQVSDGLYLVVGGVEKKTGDMRWRVAKPISKRFGDHISRVVGLTGTEVDRLFFFQRFLHHDDPNISSNAHREFVTATDESFDDVSKSLDRVLIRQWLQEKDLAADRERLYLAMLARCGNDEDAKWLQRQLSANAFDKLLNIRLGCYLALREGSGLSLINQILANPDSTYAQHYAVIQAVRFNYGLPNTRMTGDAMIASFRLVLNNEDIADIIVPDLAELRDWDSIDRLVELYKSNNNQWIRDPVVKFVRQCPQPESREILKDLEEIDPAALQRANIFFPEGATPPDRQRVILRRHSSGRIRC